MWLPYYALHVAMSLSRVWVEGMQNVLPQSFLKNPPFFNNSLQKLILGSSDKSVREDYGFFALQLQNQILCT
jgi:hypothetical protein